MKNILERPVCDRLTPSVPKAVAGMVDKSNMVISGAAPPRLTISVNEGATHLGCSVRYMYEILRRSDCTFALHLGRRVRIVRSEFERWISQQASQTATGIPVHMSGNQGG